MNKAASFADAAFIYGIMLPLLLRKGFVMDNTALWLYGFMAFTVIIGNLYVWFLFYWDKRNAKKNEWRIPEWRLIRATLLGGGIGAFFGMYISRHKTQHLKFQIIVNMSVVWQLILWSYLTYLYWQYVYMLSSY